MTAPHALIALAAFLAILGGLLIWAVRRAPIGYEDDEGWHGDFPKVPDKLAGRE